MMENELLITFSNGKKEKVPFGTTVSSLIDRFDISPDLIRACKINNKIYSLGKDLRYNSILEPVLVNSKEGAHIYRASMCLLLAAATHKLFPNARLLVGHSLGYGYYYTVEAESAFSDREIKSIEEEMKAMIKKDIPITNKFVSYEEACEIFEKNNLTQTRHLMEFMCPPRVKINNIGDFSDLYFTPLVASTGCLKVFDLMKYGDGFLLRFPRSSEPNKLRDFVDQPKLFEIYSKYKKWGKQLGVTSVSDLNQLIIDRKINDFVDISETHQEKCIADIAEQIANNHKARVVLIAGPSSSGKTTTSKKLALELQALGIKPKVISLDCFYVGRDRTPKDKDGNYDFECLEALDIELLNKDLIDLFDGKEVIIPTYDFHDGSQHFDESNKMKLGANEILIMEGIHGLNDKLTPLIPSELKFKIYLSALTQLNLDDHNRISTSDNRLIRRIVRDSRFRGKSAAGTIEMWPSVRKGEELHIFPFQNNADAVLNTALDYELSVLKVYAEPLLRCVKPHEKEYGEACHLLHFLDNFAPIDPVYVPRRSIIREFIGGSAFKY